MASIHRCPRCGSDSDRIIDSRDNYKGFKARRRECQMCGARWSTYEMTSDDYEALCHDKRAKYIKMRLRQIAESLIKLCEV